VQWNLSKIYRKLGVRSRSELAVRLTAEGGGLADSAVGADEQTPATRPVPD